MTKESSFASRNCGACNSTTTSPCSAAAQMALTCSSSKPKIAAGYDIPCRTVIDRKDLDAAIREMLDTDGPYLLQCAVKEEDNILPMTPPGANVDEMLLEISS